MAQTHKLQLIVDAENRTKTAMNSVNKSLDTVHGKLERMKPTFQKMAMAGTVAFAVIGAGIWKATQAAADAQETFSKFDTVFDDVGVKAEEVAMNLRNSWGLAESSAKSMLASTGDLLVGIGLTGDEALSLSDKTIKLGIDLASFQNYAGGATGAVAALTKGLLGEREMLKGLGIVILESDLKLKLIENGTDKLAGTALKAARAEATLQIAMEQSKKAQGDYHRTQGSLVNRQRELAERTKELSEKIGNIFIPILNSVIDKVLPVVNKFADWVEENQKLTKYIIITATAIAGLTATIGFLGLVLPGVITLIGKLKVSMITSVGPLVAVAVALSTIAYWAYEAFGGAKAQAEIESAQRLGDYAAKMAQKLRDARKPIEEVTGAIVEMGEATKETTDKIKKLEEEITKTIKDNSEKQKTYREELAEAYVQQEEKVGELIKQVKEKQNEVNQAAEKESAMAELQILQDQLAKEQTALDEHQRMKVGLYPEIVEERRKAELTEFELRVETLMKVRAKELEAFNQKIALMQQELAELKKNKSEMLSVEQQYTDKLAEEEDSRAEKTESTTQRILNSMSKRLSFMGGSLGFDTGGATTPSTLFRASGGPVRAGGSYVVGERGPELFTPGQYGKIGNSGGGGITINIQGNEFLGEEGIAERIGNSIMQSLKNTVKL